jgi:tRNA/rRNA methyltransferase
MAGTDKTRESLDGGPAIILVRPQLGENIGTSARAMLNCGLTDLRLVDPRDGWPNWRAEAAASGADDVLQKARLFPSPPEAVADLHHVYATTARSRDMHKHLVTPRQAALEMRRHSARGETCGILFGPERTGLTNDEVTVADTLVQVPLNPAFSSLNLAQAVLLISYEFFQADDHTPPRQVTDEGRKRATFADLLNFFEHLEEQLDDGGFLKPPHLRPVMIRNIRNLFLRAGLSDQEVRTLHGIVTALSGRRKGQRD